MGLERNDFVLLKERTGFEGTIGEVSLALCEKLGMKKPSLSRIIQVGDEDLNFELKIGKEKYFVKIFAKLRKDDECKTAVEAINRAVKIGVSTPKVIEVNNAQIHEIHLKGHRLRIILMEFIDGKMLQDVRGEIKPSEVKFLAKQAALMAKISPLHQIAYDWWAPINFLREYRKTRRYLDKETVRALNPLVWEYKRINPKLLPKCFVHGDLKKTNLIKDKKGKIWIVDFMVSNNYPRIQEIAVVAANVLFVETNPSQTIKNTHLFLKEYLKFEHLTRQELGAVWVYINIANAMNIIGPTVAKYKYKVSTPDNESCLKRGKEWLEYYKRGYFNA
jgi:Ser/Thr protein kinase RdoA (MazF antagonist)